MSSLPSHEVRFRPLFGRILTVVVAVVCTAGLVGVLLTGEPVTIARTAPPTLLLAVVCWALFWRPGMSVRPEGVEVVNILRSWAIAWPAIESLDTRFALTIRAAGRRIPVWAAPAPGVRGAASLHRADVSNLRESAYAGESVRPGDAVNTPSGQAAEIVRTHWESLRDAGHLASGRVEPGSVRATWHIGTIVVIAALVVASLLGAAL
jgi:hypothetical protein